MSISELSMSDTGLDSQLPNWKVSRADANPDELTIYLGEKAYLI
jgi:hypothetical protein